MSVLALMNDSHFCWRYLVEAVNLGKQHTCIDEFAMAADFYSLCHNYWFESLLFTVGYVMSAACVARVELIQRAATMFYLSRFKLQL